MPALRVAEVVLAEQPPRLLRVVVRDRSLEVLALGVGCRSCLRSQRSRLTVSWSTGCAIAASLDRRRRDRRVAVQGR